MPKAYSLLSRVWQTIDKNNPQDAPFMSSITKAKSLRKYKETIKNKYRILKQINSTAELGN